MGENCLAYSFSRRREASLQPQQVGNSHLICSSGQRHSASPNLSGEQTLCKWILKHHNANGKDPVSAPKCVFVSCSSENNWSVSEHQVDPAEAGARKVVQTLTFTPLKWLNLADVCFRNADSIGGSEQQLWDEQRDGRQQKNEMIYNLSTPPWLKHALDMCCSERSFSWVQRHTWTTWTRSYWLVGFASFLTNFGSQCSRTSINQSSMHLSRRLVSHTIFNHILNVYVQFGSSFFWDTNGPCEEISKHSLSLFSGEQIWGCILLFTSAAANSVMPITHFLLLWFSVGPPIWPKQPISSCLWGGQCFRLWITVSQSQTWSDFIWWRYKWL